MNRKSKHILLLTLTLLLAFGREVPARDKKAPCEIVILHTNDMHSKIDDFARLVYLADSIRKEHPYVFLVSAGDNFTGNPIVDMYPDPGYPMIDLMNRAGFAVSAFGNHEFDMGQKLINKRRKQARFPFISANIDAGRSELKQPKPFVILKAGKVRIPVVSFIQLGNKGLPDSHPSRLEGLEFTPAAERAKDFVWLKEKYGFLLALTHLGVEGDVPLAERYPELDVIIGGHSHTVLAKPMWVNGVMITQAGSWIRYVGKTTLTFSDGKIDSRESELIPIAGITGKDPGIQQLIDRYNNNEEMNRVIAQAVTPFENQHELGCLMTDALTSQFGLDFAFQNTGGIRIPSLPQGDIRLQDVFRLDPFGNQVVTFEMSLNEVKSLLMNSFNRNREVDMQVSGLHYTVMTDAEGSCTDVILKDPQGNLLDPGKKYKTGMNSYIAASYTFDHADPGTAQYATTAETLIAFLEKAGAADYRGVSRIDVISKTQ